MEGGYFCDSALPFGLLLALKIFNMVADALEWCTRRQGVTSIKHYLDDFIILRPPASDQCQSDLQTLQGICRELGALLVAHKRVGHTVYA